MKKFVPALLILTAFSSFTLLSGRLCAQLEVDGSVSADSLAATLLGSGVTISGISLNCPSGASGTFQCVDCNVGLASGIALTSGAVSVLPGPNNQSGAGMDDGASGDADLTAIIGDPTEDACVLEFDVTVTSDSLVFNYVFGSDEYLEFVGSFNDVFAFFISGPGIAGTQNIALIPGTTTPVSINNVNNVSHPEYYVNNGDGFTPPYDTDPYYIQYDGFTTVLQAKAVVIPCETYHLKLAVADALDHVLDSGVFIEAGSLSSPGVNVSYNTDIEGYNYLIEGCNNGYLNISLSFAPIDTFYVPLIISGTATNGTDYSFIPDTLVFYPGDTSYTLPIEAFADGLDEGVETLVLTVEAGCAIGFSDSLVLDIYDALPLDISNDTLICPQGTAVLSASGAETYSWSPPGTLEYPDSATTEAYPDESTTYTVTGTLGDCMNTADVTVNIQGPTADAGPDTTIYFGESAYLQGNGGVSYSWSPGMTLNDPNSKNPIATPYETTTYILTVTTSIGCHFTDTVTVTLSPYSVVGVPNAFSPNGDGLNDFFASIVRGELSYYDLQIYNRWGELVFETENPYNGWDGTYNGSDQPLGSYVYVLNYRDMLGSDFNKKGNFILVR